MKRSLGIENTENSISPCLVDDYHYLNKGIPNFFDYNIKDKNVSFKLNLIYKMITLLLYQKSTKLILKNVLFSIKAHILFSIFPLSFLFLCLDYKACD